MLKAVTYRKLPDSGFLASAHEGSIIDSGKLYVTRRELYVGGQRQDWSFPLSAIDEVNYDFDGWYITLRDTIETEQIFGANSHGEPDAQLVATVVETLRKLS